VGHIVDLHEVPIRGPSAERILERAPRAVGQDLSVGEGEVRGGAHGAEVSLTLG
jgi:hypothetical protein